MCLAVPGRIVSLLPSSGEHDGASLLRGKVDFGGIRKEICLEFTPEARPGDYVLVHVGFALTVIDEAEAQHVFESLRQLGQLEELSEDPA
jgi:hydrogenase expression/formation protein HypC